MNTIFFLSLSRTAQFGFRPGHCCGDQLVAAAATCTTYSKHKWRTSISWEGYELAIPAMERLQTYALDRTASVISKENLQHGEFLWPHG